MTILQAEIGEITEILSQWNDARDDCFDILFPRVYSSLKTIARKARRRVGRYNAEETLSTTALVNEVYLHLRKTESPTFKNRRDFFALCLLIMRRVLLDYYVKRSSKTRTDQLPEERDVGSSNLVNLPFLSGPEHSHFTPLEVTLIVDELLTKLAVEHPRKAEILNFKYFFGATYNEIAECLDLNERTVRRDCTLGEVMIRRELEKRIEETSDSGMFLKDLKTRGERQAGSLEHDLIALEAILKTHHKADLLSDESLGF